MESNESYRYIKAHVKDEIRERVKAGDYEAIDFTYEVGDAIEDYAHITFLSYSKQVELSQKWDEDKIDALAYVVYRELEAENKGQKRQGWHKHPELHAEAARKGILRRRGCL